MRLHARSHEVDPAALAATVFDLAGWARRAEQLCRELDAVRLDGPRALAEGFERDAEVLRHLQRDPLVPRELLPADWPGAALRERFDAFDAAYRDLLGDRAPLDRRRRHAPRRPRAVALALRIGARHPSQCGRARRAPRTGR